MPPNNLHLLGEMERVSSLHSFFPDFFWLVERDGRKGREGKEREREGGNVVKKWLAHFSISHRIWFSPYFIYFLYCISVISLFAEIILFAL